MATIRSLPTFATFGEMLHYMRRRAQMTQQELALAVGYSESMISRLEHNERPPDVATIQALFVPALHLEEQPELAAQLTQLAGQEHAERRDGHQSRPGQDWQRASRLRHPLPARLTSFVGRSQEMLTVATLLTKARLVTLAGSGGCGKTSLAIETCRWLAEVDAYAAGDQDTVHIDPFDEVGLVELFPVTDPGLLAQVVLAALGLESNPQRTALQTLIDAVGDHHMLLLLDNCEHLIDGVALFVQTLLQSCPNLRLLVASRERLNIVAETLYVVPALSCPDPQRLPALGKTKDYPAIQLFVERCQATAPGFQLVDDNMALAAHICAALDGIPLALELGAAATATLSLRDIADRLDAHLPLSGAGLRDSEPRHSSLRDTVGWSYDLLLPDEQRLLAQLSVFAGGCTLEALQQVCADELDHVNLLTVAGKLTRQPSCLTHPPGWSPSGTQ